MKKILVISDSHDSYFWKNFLKSFDFSGYDEVFHLGDDYSDIYDLQTVYSGKIVAVPGLWTIEYKLPEFENVKYIEKNEFYFILSHVKEEGNDLQSDTEKFIQLFGHSHKAEITEHKNGILFNPGHLKNIVDRGYEASFGEILIEENCVELCVKTALTQKIILEKSFEL